MQNPDTQNLVLQEASKPQLSEKGTKEARNKAKRVDEMALNKLLPDHHHKVRGNHD